MESAAPCAKSSAFAKTSGVTSTSKETVARSAMTGCAQTPLTASASSLRQHLKARTSFGKAYGDTTLHNNSSCDRNVYGCCRLCNAPPLTPLLLPRQQDRVKPPPPAGVCLSIPYGGCTANRAAATSQTRQVFHFPCTVSAASSAVSSCERPCGECLVELERLDTDSVKPP